MWVDTLNLGLGAIIQWDDTDKETSVENKSGVVYRKQQIRELLENWYRVNRGDSDTPTVNWVSVQLRGMKADAQFCSDWLVALSLPADTKIIWKEEDKLNEVEVYVYNDYFQAMKAVQDVVRDGHSTATIHQIEDGKFKVVVKEG